MFIENFFSKIVRVVLICALANLLFQGCIFSPDKSDVKSDVLLSGTDQQIAAVAKEQRSLVEYLLNNPGKEKIIEFRADTGERVLLAISFQNGNEGQFVNLRNLATNKNARISWARDGIKPAINFFYDGTNHLYDIFGGAEKISQSSLSSLFFAGLAAAAIGLAVWIGASVAKFIVATVAFLAFNLLMLGVVVATGSFIVSFFENMGWTGEVITNFVRNVFDNVVEEIKYILDNTVDMLNSIFTRAEGIQLFLIKKALNKK